MLRRGFTLIVVTALTLVVAAPSFAITAEGQPADIPVTGNLERGAGGADGHEVSGYAESTITALEVAVNGNNFVTKVVDTGSRAGHETEWFGGTVDGTRPFVDGAKGFIDAAGAWVRDKPVRSGVGDVDNAKGNLYQVAERRSNGEKLTSFQDVPLTYPQSGQDVLSYDWGEATKLICIAGFAVNEEVQRTGVRTEVRGGVRDLAAAPNVTDAERCKQDLPDHRGVYRLTEGALTSGNLIPGRLTARVGEAYAGARRLAHGETDSKARDLVALLGSSSIGEVGPGKQYATVTRDYARSSTEEVSMKDARVLDVPALLNHLGYTFDLVPLPVVATIVENLGGRIADPDGTLAEVQNFRSWSEFAAVVEYVQDKVGSIKNATGLLTCDAADLFLQNNTRNSSGVTESISWLNGELEKIGVDPIDCLGFLNALQRVQAAVDAIEDDLDSVLFTSANNTTVLSKIDFSTSLETTAKVTEQGKAEAQAVIHTGEVRLSIGNAVDGYVIPLEENAAEINQKSQEITGILNGVLDFLGPEFQDVFLLRVLPKVVEKAHIVDGRYLVASTELTVLDMMLDPPDVLPDLDAVVGDLYDQFLGEPARRVGETVEDLTGVRPISFVRDAPGVQPQAVPGSAPTTFTIGKMTNTSVFGRPGVTLDPDEKISTNRRFNPDTGQFGPDGSGGSPDGSGNLPRTGMGLGGLPIVLTAAMAGTGLWLSRTARSATALAGPASVARDATRTHRSGSPGQKRRERS